MKMRRISLVLLGVSLAVVLPAGCTAPASPPAQLAVNADPMVHCLLPSKVRKLGNLTYPARRQLVYEATNNCTLRGGEYTVYDSATAQASADFYRPLAEQGNAEA